MLVIGSCFISVLQPDSSPASFQPLPRVPDFGSLLSVCVITSSTSNANKLDPCSAGRHFPDKLQVSNMEQAKTKYHRSPRQAKNQPGPVSVLLTPPDHPLSRDCFLLAPRRITSDPSQAHGASAKGTKAKAVVGKRPLFQKI